MAAERSESDGSIQPVQKVIQPGKTAVEADQKFAGVYVVRSGSFKSYLIDANGMMQVTGFYLPGEFFGMDGIETGAHREFVEALDTSSVCRIPFDHVVSSTELSPSARESASWAQLMKSMVRLMSMSISRDHQMFFTLGRMPARQRLWTFLSDLADRVAGGGYSRTEFRLCMSRTDIANHLGLALETVSRLFTQLQAEQVIQIRGRDLKILHPEGSTAAGAEGESTGDRAVNHPLRVSRIRDASAA